MKFFYCLSMIGIIIGIGFVLYCTYLFIFPLQFITINNSPYPVVNPIVNAGDRIEFTADYCATGIATGQIVQYFVDQDGRIIVLDPKAFTTTAGCGKRDALVLVPSTLAAGTYILHSAGTYQVNPLHQFIVKSETQPFQVTRTKY